MRMLVTLSDPIRSNFVVVPGQAGNPTSSHYRDQFELWGTGRTIPHTESGVEMKEWWLLILKASRRS